MENEQKNEKDINLMLVLPPDLNAWLERQKAKTREAKTTILRGLIREKLTEEEQREAN